jgi:hypothetical protein
VSQSARFAATGFRSYEARLDHSRRRREWPAGGQRFFVMNEIPMAVTGVATGSPRSWRSRTGHLGWLGIISPAACAALWLLATPTAVGERRVPALPTPPLDKPAAREPL